VTGFYHTDFPRAYVETPLSRVAGRRVGRRLGRAALRYARRVHRRLDLTVTASPALQRKLRRLGVPGVVHVPLGVDTRTFHPERRDPALRRELGLAEGGRLLVYAGRLDAEKRVDVLLDMVRRVPADLAAKLLIVGEGPDAPRVDRAARADARILRRPFEPDRPALARLLASADCYVSAARSETFGLSVGEAQACGLPVVGQRAGAMIERVPEGTGLLVSALDPAAMAGAATTVLAGDPAAMGRAARAVVAARHGWDRTFTRLLDLYGNALGARRRGAAPAA
jgi:alpha-1,6-mannosyltransferase